MSISSEIARLSDAKAELNTFLTNNEINATSMNLNQMVNALGNLPKWTPGSGLKLSNTGELSTDLNVSKEGSYTIGVTPPSGDSSSKIATTEWVMNNPINHQGSVTQHEKVLLPSDWSSDGVSNISVNSAGTTSKIFIEPNWLNSANLANASQTLKANIVCTGVDNGIITLKCLGEIPTESIYILIYVMDQVVKDVFTFNLTTGAWDASNSSQNVTLGGDSITANDKIIASPDYANISDIAVLNAAAKSVIVLTTIGNGNLIFTALGGIPTVGVPMIVYAFN